MTQRTILFRGKNQSGEWVNGSYVAGIFDDYGHIISNCTHSDYEHGELSLNGANVVSSSTVGQFTGLTDKNGVNIFEGDIINCIDHNGTLRREIVFNKLDYFAFGWSTQSVSTHIGIGWEMEVIGNIHDNPELI